MKTLIALASWATLASATAGVTAFPPPTEPAEPAEPIDSWRFHAAIYGWGQSLNGDVTVAGSTTTLNLDFEDLAKNLDLAFMGAFGATYGRWSFVTDLNYADISGNVPTPFGIINPPGGLLPTVVGIEQEQWLLNAVVGYGLVRGESTTLDLYAGARLNSVDLELAFNRVTISGSESWIDPIVGLRVQHHFTPSFFVRASGDYGGFDVSSEETWQAMGLLGWRLHPCATVLLGYRVIDTDYRQGGFAWDLKAHGPILGLEVDF